MYRTWITEAERGFLLAQIPEERYVPPEVGQVHAPNGKDVFILHGDGGIALIAGRPFAFLSNGKAAPLFTEYRDGEEVGLYETGEVFPAIGDLREITS